MINVRINLLPWRTQARLERMQRFKKHIAIAIFSGLGIAVLCVLYIEDKINQQQARNSHIQEAISRLAKVQEQVDITKKSVDTLASRIEGMKKLAYQRDGIVMVFSEIARAIPEHIFLSKLNINDKEIKLVGISETDNSITAFSERLNASKSIASEPVMDERSDIKIGNSHLRRFNMTAERFIGIFKR